MGTSAEIHICAACGRPIMAANGLIEAGGMKFHMQCCGPPPLTYPYASMPPAEDGCRIATSLSEADVRRIVREEMAARSAPLDPTGD